MNKISSLFPSLLILLIALVFLQSCEDQVEPNITPMAEFIFFVEDENGTPIADATVYLFPFEGMYEDYKSSNLDGNLGSSPNIAAESIMATDSDGRAFFPARDLQGNGFATGTSWVYRPNSIYVRVEANQSSSFLTNDEDAASTRIAFDELSSGDFITVTTNVILK